MGESLNESGDPLAGNLNMIWNSITRLVDSTRHRDAVHKAQVDTQTLSKHGDEMLGDLQMNGRLSGDRQSALLLLVLSYMSLILC